MSKNSMEFDLIGVDPAIANALRRIMISEVPTMAIEHVYIINNTSLINDEILAHRLGLLPIFADPTKFESPIKNVNSNEKNTIVFRLKVLCYENGGYIVDQNVFSKSLEWLPNGSEMPENTQCQFSKNQNITQAVRPANSNILLAMLAPDQEIILEAHCNKGIGRLHAKWSPVATSWYKFIPEAILLQRIENEQADELANQLPGLVNFCH
jgi:DNA-directed RNA polymerase I and III subunit RPAC1